MVSNLDIYATLLDFTEQHVAQPGMTLPSRSLKSLAVEGDTDRSEDVVFAEQEETRVLRTARWAYFKRFRREGSPDLEDELFDVETDPGETRNLAQDPEYTDVLQTLDIMLTNFFETHSRAEADLWRGGRPLQNTERGELWRQVWGDDWKPGYRYP